MQYLGDLRADAENMLGGDLAEESAALEVVPDIGDEGA